MPEYIVLVKGKCAGKPNKQSGKSQLCSSGRAWVFPDKVTAFKSCRHLAYCDAEAMEFLVHSQMQYIALRTY